MDPVTLIPAPDTIPAAWGWFQFLLILTFMLHLLFMNAMLGTAFIAFVTHIRKPGSPEALPREISKKLPYAIAFTINMGVAPLLFLQVLYGHFMYTSSVLMAVHWLSVIGLLIVAYYSAYIYYFRYERLGAARVGVLGLVVVMLLTVGFIFSNNMTLMLSPQNWTAYFKAPHGLLLNFADLSLVPRWLHFMTASVAVGGLLIAVLNWFRKRKNVSGAGERIILGMRWFSYATMVQIGIGIVFLLLLPTPVRQLFLGGGTLHTGFLLLGFSGAVIALSLGLNNRVWPTVAATGATVLVMVLMRDLVRRAYLAPYFKPADLVLAPQYSPMVVFLVALVAGLAVVGYMLKLAAQPGKEVGE